MTTTTPGEQRYSRDRASIDDYETVSDNAVAKKPNTGNSKRGSEYNFPTVLHYALSQLEREGKAHIAGFLPHGRSLRVFQPQQFVDEVLTRWFRQTKFASFQRQLNIYGFARISVGPDTNTCYHEFFVRDNPELAARIQRVPVKGHGPRRPEANVVVPDFYAMAANAEIKPKQDQKLPAFAKGDAQCSNRKEQISAPTQTESIQGMFDAAAHRGGVAGLKAFNLADAVLAMSRSRQQKNQQRAVDANSPLKTTKALLLDAIARRQSLQREELRFQLEQRLIEESQGGPTLPNVLREALVSLRNSTL